MLKNDIFSDVRSLMDYAGATYADLGQALGVSRQSTFAVIKNGVLSRQVIEIIGILGYDVEYCFVHDREVYSCMSPSEGIRAIMEKNGITYTRLSELSGYNRGNIHWAVSTGLFTPRLIKIVECLGYDVELQYVKRI